MDRRIFDLLKDVLDDTVKIDRLIVSAFLNINNIQVKRNSLIRSYIIDDDLEEIFLLLQFIEVIKDKVGKKFDLEKLIELFEFVISPNDKIVTGAVYTPLPIRKFIVSTALPDRGIDYIKVADIACGCAGFLMTAANFIKQHTNKSYIDIIQDNLYGLDVAGYSVTRSKIVLALLALSQGEDRNISFNIEVGNALNYDWRAANNMIRLNDGFDYIVGNPPYVCSRNIDPANRTLLASWSVSSTGHPDLYIPFFQVALEALKPTGTLGYITVNTFFKSINGRALRGYFSQKSFDFTIIDFRNEQVFQKRNTYTCICIIHKVPSQFIRYCQANSSELLRLTSRRFFHNTYASLDNFYGWNLGSTETVVVINKIEALPKKIFPEFGFSTGIATLKNNVYKFRPVREDRRFYYFANGDKEIQIEKAICRDIINANKVKTSERLDSLKEKIIFPYAWNKTEEKYKVISEDVFRQRYSSAYKYLASKIDILAERDKKLKEYEVWYAYGRNQSLDNRGVKLFFPHITNNPSFVISEDTNLLFYNGEAIISEDFMEINVLKRILESEIFWYYIKTTSKPYSSGYYSLGKNYIKQFSIPEFTLQEKKRLLRISKEEVLRILLKKYGLKLNDIIN
jgi:adenine-specific DNA-methyltransferase